MCKLKSYWRHRLQAIDYPSLTDAKHAARLAISESRYPLSFSGYAIYHWVNGSVVSYVEIHVSDDGKVSFTRPKKL